MLTVLLLQSDQKLGLERCASGRGDQIDLSLRHFLALLTPLIAPYICSRSVDDRAGTVAFDLGIRVRGGCGQRWRLGRRIAISSMNNCV